VSFPYFERSKSFPKWIEPEVLPPALQIASSDWIKPGGKLAARNIQAKLSARPRRIDIVQPHLIAPECDGRARPHMLITHQ